MSDHESAYDSAALVVVRAQAHRVALHLMHDHPITDIVKREQGMGNVRTRGRLHALPRLWHRRRVYAYYLQLRQPLWLGADGIIYREYVDWFGNSYFMEAEIWLRDCDGLRRIAVELAMLDPCPVPSTT